MHSRTYKSERNHFKTVLVICDNKIIRITSRMLETEKSYEYNFSVNSVEKNLRSHLTHAFFGYRLERTWFGSSIRNTRLVTLLQRGGEKIK